MNYAFTKAAIDYLGLNKKNALEISYQLNSLLIRNNDICNDMMLNLLDTHDTDRFFTTCKKDFDLLLCALALQFCFKGIPGLYYGIEIPLEGGYDPDNRRPMNFSKINYDSNYYKTLKALINLRTTNKALAKGDINILAEDDVLYIKRKYLNKCVTLCINNSNKDYRKIFNKILISNKLENNLLKKKGFVIYEEV